MCRVCLLLSSCWCCDSVTGDCLETCGKRSAMIKLPALSSGYLLTNEPVTDARRVCSPSAHLSNDAATAAGKLREKKRTQAAMEPRCLCVCDRVFRTYKTSSTTDVASIGSLISTQTFYVRRNYFHQKIGRVLVCECMLSLQTKHIPAGLRIFLSWTVHLCQA